MNGILLDTHVWIWLALERKKDLSKKARSCIRQARQKWISGISCWELAKLVEKKRISFSIPTITWIRRSVEEHRLLVTELSPEIAVESTQLNFHADPADQMIIATSRLLGLPLITSDSRILAFQDVESIW